MTASANHATRRRQPSVAIIGAGVGGVATAVKLQRAGLTNFTVFEKSIGAGGTWRDNHYPGCEVDIQSHFYSFSFMPWDWPSTHATQPELLRYIEATIDHFDIRDRFRFSTGVRSATWNHAESAYDLVLESGETCRYDAIVSCVGLLNNPNFPDWPGLEEFQGHSFHTARWDHDYDLSDKRVAVVGTGSTAAQVVPAIAPDVSHLYLFQREPGWVVPKNERAFTPAERARYVGSVVQRKLSRLRAFRTSARLVAGLWREDKPLNTEFRNTALAYIDEAIDDRELRRMVTPDFPFGCKRTVQASTFYPALNRENVTLVPHAVTSLTTKGVVAGGAEYEVDAVIIGIGFQPQNFLATVEIVGADGRSLHDTWAGTAVAYLGITVAGFPNLFMVYGPNTNGGGSIIYQNERQAEVVVRMVRRLSRGARYVDTTRGAMDRYVRWIDKTAESRLTAQKHCHNYYYSPTGRNVTQFPGSPITYHLLTLAGPLLGIRSHGRRRSGARWRQR